MQLLRKFAEEKVGNELQFHLQEDAGIQLSLGGHEQTPWTVEPPAGQVVMVSLYSGYKLHLYLQSLICSP